MKSLGCVVWRYFLIGVLAWLAIASSPAFAQNTDYCEGRPFTVERGHVICSKHFLLAGKCDGTDQVQKWAVSQWNGQLVGWKIGPWLNYPIGFIGVIIDDYSMSAHSAYPWFVGNNVVPDPMTEMAPDKNRVQTFYQHGYSWPFPAVQSSTDQDYVDLHGPVRAGAMPISDLTFTTRPKEHLRHRPRQVRVLSAEVGAIRFRAMGAPSPTFRARRSSSPGSGMSRPRVLLPCSRSR